jgi:predicted homoserine dehydrogenase-like protein
MPAADSLARGCLPIGLAQGVPMTRAVQQGEVLNWADVRLDETTELVRVRREMEAAFRPEDATRAAE